MQGDNKQFVHILQEILEPKKMALWFSKTEVCDVEIPGSENVSLVSIQDWCEQEADIHLT